MKKCFLLAAILFVFALPVKGQVNPVILTWSANSYTPVEYLGKALPSSGSRIDLAATVFHSEPEKLSFTWTLSRNYYLQKKITEKGKQTFDFVIDENIHTIEVLVRDEQNAIIGQTSISIKPVEPEIVLLAGQPANDASDLMMKKYQLTSNQSLEFTAVPYFFNISNPDELNYDWKFDNQSAEEDPENSNIFDLKIGEVASTLLKNIQLSVENFDVSAQLILVP